MSSGHLEPEVVRFSTGSTPALPHSSRTRSTTWQNRLVSMELTPFSSRTWMWITAAPALAQATASAAISSGVMMCCKHFGKQMMEHGYGKIINVSSVRGKIATRAPGNAAYCSTKGAVDMMTRQLAAEFGPHGITVNAIAPTVTETPMMTAVIEQRGGDAYRKQQADALPMRRMAVPQDCVGPAVFLASHASDFVTGNIIYPDGGLTAVG